jgi:hypothetical protein
LRCLSLRILCPSVTKRVFAIPSSSACRLYFASSILDVMKSSIYDSLAVINQSAEQIAEQLEILMVDGFFTSDTAHLHKLAVEELRSTVCASITVNVHQQEMLKSVDSEKQRLELEQKLVKRIT